MTSLTGPATTSTRGIGRTGLLYVAAGAVQLSAFIFVLPIVTRELSESEYGRVAVGLVVYQLTFAVAHFGLPGVAGWALYERRQSALDEARRLVTASTAIALLMAVGAHAAGPLWSRVFEDIEYGGLLVSAVFMVVPATLAAACQSVLLAQARPVAFVVSSLVTTIGGQGMGVALLELQGSPSAYFAGLFAGSCAGAAVAAASVRPAPWKFPAAATLSAAIRHGGPTVPHALAFMVLAMGDRVLIERLMSIEAAGRYQAAYLIGGLTLNLMQAVNYSWAPAIYGALDEDRWELLRASTLRMYVVVCVAVAALCLAAPLILGLFVAEGYDPDGLVVVTALVAFSVVPAVTYTSGVHILFQQKRTGALWVIMPVAAAVNVGFNLILIPAYGLAGAAAATGVGYVVTALGATVASRRVVSLPSWAGPAVGAHLSAVGIVLATSALPTDGVALVGRTTAGVIVGLMAIAVLLRLDVTHQPSQPAETT